ncbi:hypothetical protein A6M21_08025 [Desulfotomaculum copahuensis]|uniref:SCP2 domain-containing protein n=1 Tax=Desulfotomaculum copahuensis TaxID=1838280 RepID=A0A1B7LFZ4_9FIRM|nr:hypothetical protein A6M21_08025 [Desulfotomaculum copahuensis]
MIEAMPDSFAAKRAKKRAFQLGLDLKGGDGGRWTVDIEEEKCLVREGLSEKPDLLLQGEAGTFMRCAQGRQGWLLAFLSGELKFRGNPMLLDRLHGLFPGLFETARDVSDGKTPPVAAFLRLLLVHLATGAVGLRGSIKSLYHSARHRVPIICSNRLTVAALKELDFKNGFLSMGTGFLRWEDACRNEISILNVKGRLSVNGEVVVAPNARIFISPRGHLQFKGQCIVGPYTEIHCSNAITIGNGCLISDYTRVLDSDRHTVIVDNTPVNPDKEIVIGDHVWIGASCIIKKGVHIGSGSIVAAGSLVAGDVPPHTLVAGMPAKVLRENVDWDPVPLK